MKKRVAFIGHRNGLPNDIRNRIYNAVKNEIELGYKYFSMGTHGDFDLNAFSICKELKTIYNIKIEVVITSLNQINSLIYRDKFGKDVYNPYENIDTIMYEIENIHYKRKILISNMKMIDDCDTLICYVNNDNNKSGAKTIMNYAIKKGIKVINLYKKEDSLSLKFSKIELQEYLENFNNKYKI